MVDNYVGTNTVRVFPSANHTFFAVNYNAENTQANQFLSLFDIWGSHGQYKVSEDKVHQEVWFETSREFAIMCIGGMTYHELNRAMKRMNAELVVEHNFCDFDELWD